MHFQSRYRDEQLEKQTMENERLMEKYRLEDERKKKEESEKQKIGASKCGNISPIHASQSSSTSPSDSDETNLNGDDITSPVHSGQDNQDTNNSSLFGMNLFSEPSGLGPSFEYYQSARMMFIRGDTFPTSPLVVDNGINSDQTHIYILVDKYWIDHRHQIKNVLKSISTMEAIMVNNSLLKQFWDTHCTTINFLKTHVRFQNGRSSYRTILNSEQSSHKSILETLALLYLYHFDGRHSHGRLVQLGWTPGELTTFESLTSVTGNLLEILTLKWDEISQELRSDAGANDIVPQDYYNIDNVLSRNDIRMLFPFFFDKAKFHCTQHLQQDDHEQSESIPILYECHEHGTHPVIDCNVSQLCSIIYLENVSSLN
jgi:hypothetical protein